MEFTKEDHALGFRKYSVKFRNRKIRLHIWRGTEPILHKHNHGWSFVSVPLWGTFTDNRWYVTPGSTDRRYTWLCSQGADDQPIETDTYDRLILRKKHTRIPFMPYVCKSGEVHSYYPNSKRLHVSLVFVGRKLSDESTTWR